MRKGDRLTLTGILTIVGVIVVSFVVLGILSSFGGVDEKKDTAKIEDVGSISKTEFNHWYLVVSKQPQPGQKKAKPPHIRLNGTWIRSTPRNAIPASGLPAQIRRSFAPSSRWTR